jgi:microsomal dipeptidase-like Zn-dependent dipeptidase
VSDAALQLHATLRVADLHADTLLWRRDFLVRGTRGHVDLPRLAQGGVVLQVMGAVTKSPAGQNYESNARDARDNITLLAIAQAWPPRTWSSLLERALYQAGKLERFADESDQLELIRTASGLERFLAAGTDGRVATVLATEGAHPLEGSIDNLDRLWDAGYRVLGLHHFFDNALGGSLHGESGNGLTDFGRAVVRAAVEKGFIIDVAHSSPASVDDVLALTSKPVIVSHTGLKGTCDSPRNLADDQFLRIAGAGGLIGIGFWDAVCDITPAGIARSIAYAVELVGVEHVALGSDFDGSTTVAFDASELAVLTQALLDAGLDEAAIRQIMGENQIGFFSTYLP